MRILSLLAAACLAHAQSTLVSLIESAQNNERIESYRQQTTAASLGYESARRSYLPRIDGFANAAYVDRTGGFDAKQTYTAGVRGEFVVFDGFRRDHLLDQNKALENAARHRTDAAKKEVALGVIQRYFELQNTLDDIETLAAMRRQIEAQLSRLEKFKEAGLASEDALMRMRSELSNARYRIEDLEYHSDRQRAELQTITNQTLTDLETAHVVSPEQVQPRESDTLAALRYSRDAKLSEARQQESSALPTFKVEDHYTFYDYYNDPIAPMRVDRQNKLIASLGMNLIDFSAAETTRQLLMAQAQAQSSDLAYALKESRQELQVASLYIDRARAQIEASQSAYDASVQTFESVRRKYEARVVDYVTYLDALHTLADATSRLNRAKRNLHYAYAAYYYYAGLDPKEFVR